MEGVLTSVAMYSFIIFWSSVSDDRRGDSSGSMFSEVGSYKGLGRLSFESVTWARDSTPVFSLMEFKVRKSL